MSGEQTIQLKYPVTVGDEIIESITLQRPKVKHMKLMDSVDGEIEKAVVLIAALSGQSAAVVSNIDASDFTTLSTVLGDFLGFSLPTGAI